MKAAILLSVWLLIFTVAALGEEGQVVSKEPDEVRRQMQAAGAVPPGVSADVLETLGKGDEKFDREVDQAERRLVQAYGQYWLLSDDEGRREAEASYRQEWAKDVAAELKKDGVEGARKWLLWSLEDQARWWRWRVRQKLEGRDGPVLMWVFVPEIRQKLQSKPGGMFNLEELAEMEMQWAYVRVASTLRGAARSALVREQADWKEARQEKAYQERTGELWQRLGLVVSDEPPDGSKGSLVVVNDPLVLVVTDTAKGLRDGGQNLETEELLVDLHKVELQMAYYQLWASLDAGQRKSLEESQSSWLHNLKPLLAELPTQRDEMQNEIEHQKAESGFYAERAAWLRYWYEARVKGEPWSKPELCD